MLSRELRDQKMAHKIIAREKPIETDTSLGRILPWLQQIKGEVLEIGAGAGILLQCLPAGVRYTAVEPNKFLHPAIMSAAAKQGIVVAQLLAQPAENLPFVSSSFDAIVSVRALCAVPNLPKTLSEIRRVLKPGGFFIFAEHVAAPAGSWRYFLQKIMTPLWRYRVGCSPSVNIEQGVRSAGFSLVEITPFSVGGRRNVVVRLRIYGRAQK